MFEEFNYLEQEYKSTVWYIMNWRNHAKAHEHDYKLHRFGMLWFRSGVSSGIFIQYVTFVSLVILDPSDPDSGCFVHPVVHHRVDGVHDEGDDS